MKKTFSWLSLLCFGLTYIYIIYYAFTTFKLWVGLVALLAPVVGNMFVCGAAIEQGNWLPMILFCVTGLMYLLSIGIVQKAEESKT